MDHIVTKPFWSRVTYTVCLLNIVVWLPLWLKLISVRRHTTAATPVSLFDPHIHTSLSIPSFDSADAAEECGVCPNGLDVTFPAHARILNFSENVPPFRSVWRRLLDARRGMAVVRRAS